MHRLYHLLFKSNTEYAELLLGATSLFMGFWLTLDLVHVSFMPTIVDNSIPEIWGSVLMASGLLKLIGVFYEQLFVRKISCMLATLVWLCLTLTLLDNRYPRIATPAISVFALFNALIYIKLSLVRINPDV